MTSPGQVAGATQQAAGQTASTAKDEAAQVTSTAAAAASDVAGTAKQQAGQVAGEAVNQLKSLTDDARSQAAQQAGNATEKLSTTVRSLASEVRDMSQGKGDASGTLAGLAAQLADKGEQLADHISSQGPGGLVQDLRSFASRRPGTFLLGALAAGVVTGRLVKGATGQPSVGSMTPSTSGVPTSPSSLAGSYGQDAYASSTAYPASTYPEPTYGADDVSGLRPATTPQGAYSGTVPIVHSDDTGLLDADVNTIGAVSGDQRLLDEGTSSAPYEPGTGLR